jgi:hypothetical protein
MRPTRQTVVGYPEGNCYAACVASLLEIPLEECPIIPGDADFNAVWAAWYAERGIGRLVFTYQADYSFPGYQILSGWSPRGMLTKTGERAHHSVVGKYCIPVFDPHPDGTFLDGSIREIDVLYPLDPKRLLWA